MLPLVGIGGRFVLDDDTTGARSPAYEDAEGFLGEGDYPVTDDAVTLDGEWRVRGDYATSDMVGATYGLAYNGTGVRLRYTEGPDRSEWAAFIDGVPVDDDDDEPLFIDGYNPAERRDVEIDLEAPEAGPHVLTIVNTDRADSDAGGTVMSIGEATCSRPRASARSPRSWRVCWLSRSSV